MPDTSAPLQEALAFLANRRSLSERLTAQVFGVVVRGAATPAQVAALLMGLREACVTFLFAPNFHPAMKHVGPVRRELGVPSVMNLVGPLANPAGARRQVLGVADPERVALMAEALARLGAEHAMVVHGRIGMDEVSPLGMTDVWEVRDGR